MVKNHVNFEQEKMHENKEYEVAHFKYEFSTNIINLLVKNSK